MALVSIAGPTCCSHHLFAAIYIWITQNILTTCCLPTCQTPLAFITMGDRRLQSLTTQRIPLYFSHRTYFTDGDSFRVATNRVIAMA